MIAYRFLKQWLKSPLNLKYVVRSRISSRSRFCPGESRVLSAVMFQKMFLIRRAWSMGIIVQSGVTSKDIIISSGSIICWHMKVENDLELWVCCSFSLP